MSINTRRLRARLAIIQRDDPPMADAVRSLIKGQSDVEIPVTLTQLRDWIWDLLEALREDREEGDLPTCGDPECRGWCLINGNEIQRCDECGVFADDEEVIAYLMSLEAR